MCVRGPLSLSAILSTRPQEESVLPCTVLLSGVVLHNKVLKLREPLTSGSEAALICLTELSLKAIYFFLKFLSF